MTTFRLTLESDIFFFYLFWFPSFSKLPSSLDCKTENPDWSLDFTLAGLEYALRAQLDQLH